MLRHCVWSKNLTNEEALVHRGAVGPKKIFRYIFSAWWLIRHTTNLIFYLNTRTVHLVQFIIQTDKCRTFCAFIGLDNKLINLAFNRR